MARAPDGGTTPITGLAPGAALWAVLVAALLGGCAGIDVYRAVPASAHLHGDGRFAECTRLYARTDDRVAQYRVGDALAARISGFPYLRVDRFGASFAPGFAADGVSEPAWQQWVDRLRRLDAEARRFELANLPGARADPNANGANASSAAADEASIPARRAALLASLEECARILASADLSYPAGREALLRAARVPPSYNAWQRVAGVYPLARIPFAAGVRAWHRRVLASYARAAAEIPVLGRALRYAPPAGNFDAKGAGDPMTYAAIAAIYRRALADPLGIPDPTTGETERLFATFAPVFELDTNGADDRLGTLAWGVTDVSDERNGGVAASAADERLPVVDTGLPSVYRRLSYARVRGRVLLQLNYSVWFPGRPAASDMDLLAGRYDGLTWRVTLSEQGHPLLYDTIHNCGCYHMFYPVAPVALAPRRNAEDTEELILVPQRLPAIAAGQRLTLRLESGTHYLVRVTAEDPAGVSGNAVRGARRTERSADRTYAFADDDALRSLPFDSARRKGIFGPDGLLAGSERSERFLFWPMGVPSAGAMRIWGRHATAFIGQRHFDDPDLIDRLIATP